MPNSTRKNISNKENVKMRKLIVEAPELKEGQTDSSGGIRENGKISVQYKNPVPYVEPTLPPATTQKPYTYKDMIKDQAKDFAIGVGQDLVSMLWYEYGRPFLQAKLHQLGQNAVSRLENQNTNTHTINTVKSSASKVIDAEYVEIQEADEFDNSDKIIRFPKQRVS